MRFRRRVISGYLTNPNPAQRAYFDGPAEPETIRESNFAVAR